MMKSMKQHYIALFSILDLRQKLSIYLCKSDEKGMYNAMTFLRLKGTMILHLWFIFCKAR